MSTDDTPTPTDAQVSTDDTPTPTDTPVSTDNAFALSADASEFVPTTHITDAVPADEPNDSESDDDSECGCDMCTWYPGRDDEPDDNKSDDDNESDDDTNAFDFGTCSDPDCEQCVSTRSTLGLVGDAHRVPPTYETAVREAGAIRITGADGVSVSFSLDEMRLGVCFGLWTIDWTPGTDSDE